MAGSTPHEAVQIFIRSLQQALHCVTDGVIRASRSGGYRLGQQYGAVLAAGDRARLRKLESDDSFGLKVEIHFRIARDPALARAPYRIETIQYIHTLGEWAADRRILAFHWHPDQTPDRRLPHLHLYTASGVIPTLEGRHIPSGHIPLESVLRFLIEEMNVRHSANWEEVLRRTQETFDGASERRPAES